MNVDVAARLPVLDAAHLARRTGGLPSVEVEVLALFSAEAERLLTQIEAASDAQVRSSRIQAMAALAGGIGALRLADAAGRVEAASDQPDISAVRLALREVLALIQGSSG